MAVELALEARAEEMARTRQMLKIDGLFGFLILAKRTERMGACLVYSYVDSKGGEQAALAIWRGLIEAQLSRDGGRNFARAEQEGVGSGSVEKSLVCSLHVRCLVLARRVQELEMRAVGGRPASF